MRLIDADALHTLLIKTKSIGELSAKKAIRYVEEATTIDAVQVIRCYECRYYNGGISDPLRDPWCDFHEGVATDPNNYCSWAKREGSVFGNGTNE